MRFQIYPLWDQFSVAENAVLVWTQGETGIKDVFSNVSGLVSTVPKMPLFKQPIGFIDVREVFAI